MFHLLDAWDRYEDRDCPSHSFSAQASLELGGKITPQLGFNFTLAHGWSFVWHYPDSQYPGDLTFTPDLDEALEEFELQLHPYFDPLMATVIACEVHERLASIVEVFAAGLSQSNHIAAWETEQLPLAKPSASLSARWGLATSEAVGDAYKPLQSLEQYRYNSA